MRKILLIIGIILGILLMILALGFRLIFHGMIGIPLGKAIVASNTQKYLCNVYPSIKFDIKEMEHDFKTGDIIRIKAQTKNPIDFCFLYNYNDEDFLYNLVVRKFLDFDEKAVTINPILPNVKYNKLKNYQLVVNMDWYEDKLTKADFLKKSISIYDLLISEGVYPDKIYFESKILIKYHSNNARYATDSWDYSLFRIDLDKSYQNNRWEELINRVEEKFHDCELK